MAAGPRFFNKVAPIRDRHLQSVQLFGRSRLSVSIASDRRTAEDRSLEIVSAGKYVAKEQVPQHRRQNLRSSHDQPRKKSFNAASALCPGERDQFSSPIDPLVSTEIESSAGSCQGSL